MTLDRGPTCSHKNGTREGHAAQRIWGNGYLRAASGSNTHRTVARHWQAVEKKEQSYCVAEVERVFGSSPVEPKERVFTSP